MPGWGVFSDGREILIVQHHRLLEMGVENWCKTRVFMYKLPRIIFVLMYRCDYVISHIISGARSSVLIDGKVL